MNDRDGQSRLWSGPQDCLFAGLEALGRGQDALLCGLHQAHEQIGACNSIWLAAGGSGMALCDERGARRVQELPDGTPGRWLLHSRSGPLRLIGPDWLRRDPQARALCIDWGLVAGAGEHEGRVWFGAQRPLEVNEAWTHSVMRALRLLEELQGRQAQELRRERLAAMGQQAASLAHDLRNQLSLTRLEFDSFALREGPPLERASAALDEALEMCRSFLTKAPLEAQEAAQPLAPHLRSQIEQSVRLSGRQGEVRVVLRCEGELRAKFEAPLLKRYLRNLLLNALAATPRGAAVRVEARRTADGRVELSVTDEGHGMEPADLERLLHAGETRGGTGFGTSSVFDCAQAMAADLDVESKPAAGTRFCLSLAGA